VDHRPAGVLVVSIPTARDTAQQVVTLLVHGERHEAVDIAAEYDDHLVLSLVLADLVAYVHYRWSRACDMDHQQKVDAWRSLLADVEEWRLTKEAS
jgi:hypothetical protein